MNVALFLMSKSCQKKAIWQICITKDYARFLLRSRKKMVCPSSIDIILLL